MAAGMKALVIVPSNGTIIETPETDESINLPGNLT